MNEIARPKKFTPLFTIFALLTTTIPIILANHIYIYLSAYDLPILVLGGLFFISIPVTSFFMFISLLINNNFWWLKNNKINPYKGFGLSIILTFMLSLILSYIGFLLYYSFCVFYLIY